MNTLRNLTISAVMVLGTFFLIVLPSEAVDLRMKDGRRLDDANIGGARDGKIQVTFKFGPEKTFALGRYEIDAFTEESQTIVLQALKTDKDTLSKARAAAATNQEARASVMAEKARDQAERDKAWEVNRVMREYVTSARHCVKVAGAAFDEWESAAYDPENTPMAGQLRAGVINAVNNLISLQNEWSAYSDSTSDYTTPEQLDSLSIFTKTCTVAQSRIKQVDSDLAERAKIAEERWKQMIQERKERERLDIMRRQAAASERQAQGIENLTDFLRYGF